MTHTVGRPSVRLSKSFVAERFIATVGGQDHAVRGLTIWPIADVLRFVDSMDSAWTGAAVDEDQATGADAAAGLLHDLLESSMISPPRLRHRRERAVSSRAVFYQSADRIPG